MSIKATCQGAHVVEALEVISHWRFEDEMVRWRLSADSGELKGRSIGLVSFPSHDFVLGGSDLIQREWERTEEIKARSKFVEDAKIAQ